MKPLATPAMGKRPSLRPKVYWARNPSTKTGMDTTSVVDTRTSESKNDFARIPARTPATRPNTVSKASATKASLTVTGTVCFRISETGRPLKSVPRSPCARPAMYLPYWTGRLSSRLYCSVSWAAIAGGIGRSPPSARIGSPGSAKTIAKMRNDAPNSTGIASSRRRAM